MSNPSIHKSSGELRWLVDRINAAEGVRREARSQKRQREWEAEYGKLKDANHQKDESGVFDDGVHQEGGAAGFPPTPAMNYGLSAALLFVTFAASVLGAVS